MSITYQRNNTDLPKIIRIAGQWHDRNHLEIKDDGKCLYTVMNGKRYILRNYMENQ